jgi:hypothetical protein
LPAGADALRVNSLVIRYSSYALLFLAVVIAVLSSSQGDAVLPGALLLAGAVAGAISLHLSWDVGFRGLFGAVTVLSAFWTELDGTEPFYVGWVVLFLGMGALLIGGLSLDMGYLTATKVRSGKNPLGVSAMRRMVLMTGTYLLIVLIISLAAVIASFIFILESFPLWSVGVTTAILVLMFAYIISKSAGASDQSG